MKPQKLLLSFIMSQKRKTMTARQFYKKAPIHFYRRLRLCTNAVANLTVRRSLRVESWSWNIVSRDTSTQKNFSIWKLLLYNQPNQTSKSSGVLRRMSYLRRSFQDCSWQSWHWLYTFPKTIFCCCCQVLLFYYLYI